MTDTLNRNLPKHNWIKIGSHTYKCAACEILKEVIYDPSVRNKSRTEFYKYGQLLNGNPGCLQIQKQ